MTAVLGPIRISGKAARNRWIAARIIRPPQLREALVALLRRYRPDVLGGRCECRQDHDGGKRRQLSKAFTHGILRLHCVALRQSSRTALRTAAGQVPLAPPPDDLAVCINWNIYFGVTIADLRPLRFGGARRGRRRGWYRGGGCRLG